MNTRSGYTHSRTTPTYLLQAAAMLTHVLYTHQPAAA